MGIFLEQNDQRVAEILKAQQTDKHAPFYGGFPRQNGICYVGTAAWNANRMAAAWMSAGSRFFHSDQVEGSLDLAMAFLKRSQHTDGTIDLVSTNYHSTPDTGFVVEPTAQALSCVRQHAPQGLVGFQEAAEVFLRHAGEALKHGGVHTPNHRWVVCMALARIHRLFPDHALLARIDQWLAEKIDIDSDGQYTERSTSIYTPLVDRCLITMARLLEREELFEPVRKNLEVTKYLVHVNGEIVTEISRRQDRYRIAKLARYYYPYRYMAILDGDGTFAAMAQSIEESVGRTSLSSQLTYLLEDPLLGCELPRAAPLPRAYERSFPESNMVRIRRGNVDATILAHNETLLTFCKGRAALRSVRLASAFFGKGQFVAQSLEKVAGQYVLRQALEGAYYQPFPDRSLPQDGAWARMPREARAKSEIQRLDTEVAIRESNGSFTLVLHIDGTDNVPWAIELAFDREGSLDGVEKADPTHDSYLLKGGFGGYELGEDRIRFGPGRADHAWTELRGAQAKLDAQCVYLTGFTPMELELTIA